VSRAEPDFAGISYIATLAAWVAEILSIRLLPIRELPFHSPKDA